jgi:hypothetical protein
VVAKPTGNNGNGFKRSPSTNSNLSLAANFRMPVQQTLAAFGKRSSVSSLKSPQEEEAVRLPLRTFSPEPLASRIPPVISEHETYQPELRKERRRGSF